MHRKRSGFTVLELLVVVGLIALLAAIVLAAVTSARNKSKDRAIQSNMLTIRTQANLYFDTGGNGAYGSAMNPATQLNSTTCVNAATMFGKEPTIAAAIAALTSYVTIDRIACWSTGTTFAVAATLTNQDYFCIDSNSAGKVNTGRGGLFDTTPGGTDTTAAIAIYGPNAGLCH